MKIQELISELYKYRLDEEVLADEKPIKDIVFGRMNEGGTLRPAVNISVEKRFEEKI